MVILLFKIGENRSKRIGSLFWRCGSSQTVANTQLGRVAVLIETLSSNQQPDGLSHNLSVEMISQMLMQRGFHWEGLVNETLHVTRGPSWPLLD